MGWHLHHEQRHELHCYNDHSLYWHPNLLYIRARVDSYRRQLQCYIDHGHRDGSVIKLPDVGSNSS